MATHAYRPKDPEHDIVALEFANRGISLQRWKEYSFLSHFLTPADGWSFTTSHHDELEVLRALQPGELVRLKVNEYVLSTGYIDTIETRSSRDGGCEVRIDGRDRFGQVVDAHVDPDLTIKETQSLADVLKAVFAPFGWSNDEDFALAEETDESALSTDITGVKRSKKKGQPTKSFKLHQHQAMPGEGAFQFAARVANRQGLWIWLSTDGETVIVGKPSFDLGPIARLQFGGRESNVLTSTVRQDLSGQPSVIIATAFTGGGDFAARNYALAYAMNPSVRVKGKFDNLPPKSVHPSARKVELFPQPTALVAPYVRPYYIHDDKATTTLQLENFIKRELSVMQRNALTVHCTVEGHGFDYGRSFVPWTINTIVDYVDDNAGINESLWILGRTFKRSRESSGTTTDLELIRLNTLSF